MGSRRSSCRHLRTLGGFGFAGERSDDESGLVYLRARHYDTATGRFLQADPDGMAGSGPNRYQYAGNNPTDYVDPGGLSVPELAADAAAVVFGAEAAIAALVLDSFTPLSRHLPCPGQDTLKVPCQWIVATLYLRDMSHRTPPAPLLYSTLTEHRRFALRRAPARWSLAP